MARSPGDRRRPVSGHVGAGVMRPPGRRPPAARARWSSVLNPPLAAAPAEERFTSPRPRPAAALQAPRCQPQRLRALPGSAPRPHHETWAKGSPPTCTTRLTISSVSGLLRAATMRQRALRPACWSTLRQFLRAVSAATLRLHDRALRLRRERRHHAHAGHVQRKALVQRHLHVQRHLRLLRRRGQCGCDGVHLLRP